MAGGPGLQTMLTIAQAVVHEGRSQLACCMLHLGV